MQLRRVILLLAFLALPSLLIGCADMPQSSEAQAEVQANNDPYESTNRVIFDVNDFMDRLLIKPLAELYRFAMPDYLRQRIANILANMGEPVIFANNLMQGEGTKAGVTAERFLINTTVGAAGIFEVASGWGLSKQEGDFGQTLYVWGAGSGPYLVLPFFGPSDVRDAIGLGVDTLMSPWQWIARLGGNGTYNRFIYSDFAADGLTRREESLDDLDALREGSLDFYAEMRSVYKQYRDKQLGIQGGQAPVFEDYE